MFGTENIIERTRRTLNSKNNVCEKCPNRGLPGHHKLTCLPMEHERLCPGLGRAAGMGTQTEINTETGLQEPDCQSGEQSPTPWPSRGVRAGFCCVNAPWTPAGESQFWGRSGVRKAQLQFLLNFYHFTGENLSSAIHSASAGFLPRHLTLQSALSLKNGCYRMADLGINTLVHKNRLRRKRSIGRADTTWVPRPLFRFCPRDCVRDRRRSLEGTRCVLVRNRHKGHSSREQGGQWLARKRKQKGTARNWDSLSIRSSVKIRTDLILQNKGNEVRETALTTAGHNFPRDDVITSVSRPTSGPLAGISQNYLSVRQYLSIGWSYRALELSWEMSRWMRHFWDLKETNQGPRHEMYTWGSLGSTDETQGFTKE